LEVGVVEVIVAPTSVVPVNVVGFDIVRVIKGLIVDVFGLCRFFDFFFKHAVDENTRLRQAQAQLGDIRARQ
jgi:hypothetical protein